MSATRELELLVASQTEREDAQDVVMLDANSTSPTGPSDPANPGSASVPGTSNLWTDGTNDDYEMVDYAS